MLAGVAGGAAQSVLGFGAAIIVVPALAIAEPELLPVASMFAMYPLIITMAWRGRAAADFPAAGRMFIGRIPGVAVGSWLVVTLDTRAITVFVAAILLFAVVSMARGWSIPITRRTETVAGFVSAVTGTSTGLGGPPVALLYRDVEGARMRATLATLFLTGTTLSLSVLAVLGEVTARHASIGLTIGAGTVVGLVVVRGLVERMAPELLRQGILVWAATGAVVAVARAVVA